MNKDNLHLLFVVNTDYFFISHRLSIALACIEQGYRVSLITKDTGKRAYLESLGIDFYDFQLNRGSKSPLQNLKELWILRKLYHQINPDLIQHVGIKLILLGSLARLGLGQSIVLQAVAGLGSALSPNKESILKRIFFLLGFMFRKSYQHFLFQNEQNAQFFQRLLYLKNAQITLIKGTGIDIKYFVYTPESTHNGLKVRLVARMLKDKGILDFVKAAHLLKSKWVGKVTFELIGPIDEANPSAITQDELEAIVDNFYLVWKGAQSPILPFLQTAHIIVLPSYHEGFPRILLEASAVGRAIIASSCDGCKALIEHQKNGLIVPIGDFRALAQQIDYLLENPQIRHRLGYNARQIVVDNYTEQKVNHAFLELYHRLLYGK
ncbi:MAG: glycosyltransferase family 4 protein [Flectobacillus sp.]|uniref:glycosyltransferase family 4 protein n=1 Tax=Flectobacillus sp. TaxID=50419 RepID=UPI003B99DAC6